MAGAFEQEEEKVEEEEEENGEEVEEVEEVEEAFGPEAFTTILGLATPTFRPIKTLGRGHRYCSNSFDGSQMASFA